MKKIKILQVTGCLHIGGIEKLVLSFYEKVDREKYVMDFLVFGEDIGVLEKNVEQLGGRIIRVPKPNKDYYKYYKAIKKAIEENGPYDVVHSHVLFNSGFVMRAAAKCKIPIRISHSHDCLSCFKDSFIRKIYIKIMRKWLLKYSTKICACSSLAGNYLFGKEKFEKNGQVVYNAINLNKFVYSNNSRIKIRKEFNLQESDFVIGNIGRMVEQKNQEYLIEIMKKLGDMKLLLIGDGHLSEHLKTLVKNEKLENRIFFTGIRTDIADILSALDVFVLSSIHEGLGIVLVEAQANGLPCVAPKDVVPDEAKVLDNFLFCNEPSNDNIDSWVKEIREALKLGREMNSINNKKMKKYDDKLMGKVLENLYNR